MPPSSLGCQMEGTLSEMSTVDGGFVRRRTGRAVPTTSVTVALLEDNVPVAYGVVRNLS